MIYIWAALESMSARLATQRASDEAIASLRPLFTGFESSRPNEHMDEYSEANVAFHQAIIRLGGCKMIDELTKNLFIHMRAIRQSTIGQDNPADPSVMAPLALIEALERRATAEAATLVPHHPHDLTGHRTGTRTTPRTGMP